MLETEPDIYLWGMQEQLLAALVEQQSASQRLFIQANSREGTELPDVVRIPRPGVEGDSEPHRTVPFEDTPAFLQSLSALVPVKE